MELTQKFHPKPVARGSPTEKSMDLKKAMEIFHWRLRPIVGYAKDRDNPILKKIRNLAGFVPLSDLDIVSETMFGEAMAAYRILFIQESMGNPIVMDFWDELAKLSIFQGIKPFRKRQASDDEQVMFVIWVDNRYNENILHLIDEIDRLTPGFLNN